MALEAASMDLSRRLGARTEVTYSPANYGYMVVQRCPCCRDHFVTEVPIALDADVTMASAIDALTTAARSAWLVHACPDVDIDVERLADADLDLIMQHTERQSIRLMERFIALQAVASKRRSPAWLNEGAE